MRHAAIGPAACMIAACAAESWSMPYAWLLGSEGIGCHLSEGTGTCRRAAVALLPVGRLHMHSIISWMLHTSLQFCCACRFRTVARRTGAGWLATGGERQGRDAILRVQSGQQSIITRVPHKHTLGVGPERPCWAATWRSASALGPSAWRRAAVTSALAIMAPAMLGPHFRSALARAFSSPFCTSRRALAMHECSDSVLESSRCQRQPS